MLGFLKSIRSGAKLGKANACLCRGDYEAAFEYSAAAKKIGGLSSDNMWLYHSVLGKSLYHKNQEAEALENLHRAEELLATEFESSNGNEDILNYMLGVSWYINKIENRTHNKFKNYTPTARTRRSARPF